MAEYRSRGSNIYDLEALQAIFQQARVKLAVVQDR
jgi:hypothetical protein